jgi:hypothetical protein
LIDDLVYPKILPPLFSHLGLSNSLAIRTARVARQLRSAELAVFSILEANRRTIRAKVRRLRRTHELATIPTETVRNSPTVRFCGLAVPSGVVPVGPPRRNLPKFCPVLNCEQFVKVRTYARWRERLIVLASPDGPVPFIIPPIIVLYNGIAHNLDSHSPWPIMFYFQVRQNFKPPNVKDFIRHAPPAIVHSRAFASWRSTPDKIQLN